MAKKGGVQQLQVQIDNDKDLKKLFDRYPDALILLDVYSEWCGPCLGVVNALRKIKLEFGGDKLQMAIDHKSVNLMFGSNVPDLILVIKNELEMVDIPISERNYINIDEMHPEEKRREKIKNDRIAALELKERFERDKKRREYLMFCTNSIKENLSDFGVCIFGTHVGRDMFQKLNEPANALKMQCKDKRYQCITREEFETVNFVCGNPLSEDVMEQMAQNDVLICLWKISAEAGRSVPSVMKQYVQELTKKEVERRSKNINGRFSNSKSERPSKNISERPSNTKSERTSKYKSNERVAPSTSKYKSEERVAPSIIEPINIKVEYEVEEHVVCPQYKGDTPRQSQGSVKPSPTEEKLFVREEMGEEEELVQTDQVGMPAMDMADFDLGGDDNISEHIEEEEEVISVGPPPKKICTKIVNMPAVWVPNDERTHAALIYTFFRSQTLPFLPPDPPPEPPCVIMTFDTYKKRDLVTLAESNKDDIPMYGFFTSDDPDEAMFIANSTKKYVQHKVSTDDKLVFKVKKVNSDMVLTLSKYGATYVSPNVTVGKQDALKFFPPSYKTAEDDRKADLEAQKAKGPPKAGAEIVVETISDDFDTEEDIGDADYGEAINGE